MISASNSWNYLNSGKNDEEEDTSEEEKSCDSVTEVRKASPKGDDNLRRKLRDAFGASAQEQSRSQVQKTTRCGLRRASQEIGRAEGPGRELQLLG